MRGEIIVGLPESVVEDLTVKLGGVVAPHDTSSGVTPGKLKGISHS